MARIPVELTPGEAETLGAAVALLGRLEAATNAHVRHVSSPWDGMRIGQLRSTFEHAARAVTAALIDLEVFAECAEAARVLAAMDEAAEPAAVEA